MSEDINPRTYDEPAFPRSYSHDGHNGMWLRDYFAAQALVGIGNWVPGGDYTRDRSTDEQRAEMLKRRAEWAYAQADAMLAERG